MKKMGTAIALLTITAFAVFILGCNKGVDAPKATNPVDSCYINIPEREGGRNANVSFVTFYLTEKLDDFDPAGFTEVAVLKDGSASSYSLDLSRADVSDYASDSGQQKEGEGKSAGAGVDSKKILSLASIPFAAVINEPGEYKVTGKYKGSEFSSTGYAIIEGPLGDSPAKAEDLYEVLFSGGPESNYKVSFVFNGRQEAFSASDVSDLKITNGKDTITFTVSGEADRSLRYMDDTKKTVTSFDLAQDGVSIKDRGLVNEGWQLSGAYQGKEFSMPRW